MKIICSPGGALMAAKFLAKVNNVIVLAGKDKGMTGEISSVDPSPQSNRRWRNIAIRHVKQSQTNQGGRTPKAMPTSFPTSRLWMRTAKATRATLKWTATRSALPLSTGDDLMLDATLTPV
jgi:large subunit ribosomal protein L24